MAQADAAAAGDWMRVAFGTAVGNHFAAGNHLIAEDTADHRQDYRPGLANFAQKLFGPESVSA